MRNGAMWLRAIVVAVAAVAQATACYHYETPAPKHFSSANVDSVAFDSIRAYAHTLQFTTALYAADVRRVKFDSQKRSKVDPLGDSARIEPESGAWALDSNELAEGRIIAHVRTDSVHSATGYGPWWTWWWVDRRGGQ